MKTIVQNIIGKLTPPCLGGYKGMVPPPHVGACKPNPQPSTLNPQPIRGRKLLAGLLAGGCLGLTTAWAQADYATPYTFTTIAGTNGIAGFADGTNGAAQFGWPEGIVATTNDTLYVVDNFYNTVRKVVPQGTNWVVTTIAGTNNLNGGTADGTNYSIGFTYPTSIAMDRAGNLYVTDAGNNTLRKLTPVGTNWVSSTIAGTVGVPGSRDGSNSVAQFNYPSGIAVDAAGNLYVADTYNDTIRRVVHTNANWVVTTIAGLAQHNDSSDGTNQAARFFQPSAIAIDQSGNLFVADTGNSTIRELTLMGTNWVTTTIAGAAGNTGLVDGTNADASFNYPSGIAVDANDNLYVADSGDTDNAIRLVSPQGTNWVTTTLAGAPDGSAGSADGTGPSALFNSPWGIAVDAAGRVYEGETGNYVIRQGIVAAVPNLAIGPVVANSVVISWVGSSGFVLQTNGDLTTPNWGNYGSEVSSSNGTNSVTLAPPVGTLFFRLAN